MVETPGFHCRGHGLGNQDPVNIVSNLSILPKHNVLLQILKVIQISLPQINMVLYKELEIFYF